MNASWSQPSRSTGIGVGADPVLRGSDWVSASVAPRLDQLQRRVVGLVDRAAGHVRREPVVYVSAIRPRPHRGGRGFRAEEEFGHNAEPYVVPDAVGRSRYLDRRAERQSARVVRTNWARFRA